MNNNSVLLLTGTIAPANGVVKLTDPKIRYKQYLINIIRYICFSDFFKICFCENSGFDMENEKELIYDIANFFGKQLEILQFNGDYNKTLELGYGFGENEILEYAIHKSELVGGSKTFFKITGRYRCENINKILQLSQYYDNLFTKMMPTSIFGINSKKVNTAIFKSSISFFNDNLVGAGYKTNDNINISLENVYYNILKNIEKEGKREWGYLPEYPKFRGITGGGIQLKKSDFCENIMYFVHKLGINKI